MGKGSLLYVEGKLRNRNYEDKEGQKTNVAEIVADQVALLDKKTKIEVSETEDNSDAPLPF